MRERSRQLWAAIDAVGKNIPQLWKAVSQVLQQRNGAVNVLYVGGMDVDGEQKTVGVGDDMPLAPVHAFARIKTARATGLGRRNALVQR